jgi:hypothetical protein
MRLLDLFCCQGGASMGYHRAGFEVVGVDINPQPRYPFEFHQADAIEYVKAHGHKFDVIHASPPCQHDCTLTAGTNAGRFEYPDLLLATREVLLATGRPYVIEQPPGKATKKMCVCLTLCGEMFGLSVIRHRNFEIAGATVEQLTHIKHRGRVAGMRHGQWFEGPYFAVYGQGGGKGSIAQWQQAMGIDWISDRRGLAEAIPPAYTEYIGKQLLRELEGGRDPV